MNIISVINWKGGVGKTTLTHNIAACLQELPSADTTDFRNGEDFPSILLVDLDPQCSLSISVLSEDVFERMAYKENVKTIKDLFIASLEGKLETEDINDYIIKKKFRAHEGHIYPNIDLISSHPDLIYTDMDIAVYSKPNFKNNLLNSGIYKFQIIDSIVEKLEKNYDFILIDCPPNLNYITQNALYRSNYYLIPTILDKLSSYGILSITNKVKELNNMFLTASKDYIETELIGIVANNVREYNGPKQSQFNILQRLKTLFKDKMFENYLTNGDGIARTSESSYPVFALSATHANALKQSEALIEITKELLTKL